QFGSAHSPTTAGRPAGVSRPQRRPTRRIARAGALAPDLGCAAKPLRRKTIFTARHDGGTD
ncbi:MAG: hypothetical protein ABSA52_22925, partial [Candidatus Binatia bacterium]